MEFRIGRLKLSVPRAGSTAHRPLRALILFLVIVCEALEGRGRREGKRPERVSEEKGTETAGARSRCGGDTVTSLSTDGERVATGEVHDNRHDATEPRTRHTRLVPDIRQEETENVEEWTTSLL